MFIFVWIVSIFILFSQSQVAYEQLPDLVHHKSEMISKDKLLGIVYGTATIFNLFFAGLALFLPLFSAKILNRMKFSNKLIWKIFKEPGDTFWVLSVGGLYKAQFIDKKPKFVKKMSLKETDDKDKQYFATAMARYNNQSYLVATNKGVFLLENDRLFKRGVFKKDTFSMETNHLLKTRNDEWIISTTKGIIRLRGDCFTLQDKDDGLRDNYTSQTIQDKHGNLWAVTDRGIAYQALLKAQPISIGAVLNDEWVFFKQKDQSLRHFKISRGKDDGIHYLFGMAVKPISGPFIPRIDAPEIILRLFAFSPLLSSDQKASFFIQSGAHNFKIDYNQPKVLTLKSSDLFSGPVPITLDYLNSMICVLFYLVFLYQIIVGVMIDSLG